jgi:hypothetical protein
MDDRLLSPPKLALAALALIFAALCVLQAPSLAAASPCRGNGWQPTFVHDVRPGAADPGPYYVMTDGTFVRLRDGDFVNHACQLIGQFGIRDRRGWTNCQQYTRIQCGCDNRSMGNNNCARFLRSR